MVNTESTGVGIRVIANGTWGFAATSDLSNAARRQGRAAGGRHRQGQLQLPDQAGAAGPGQGRRRGVLGHADQKNAMEVPIKEKADLLLSVNAAAMAAGANFVNSMLFLVNEQKYFASTDGSYIDQDVHRIWPTFTVTAIDKTTGKFRSRDSMSSPMGMGYEYLDGERPHRAAERRGRSTAIPTT